MFKQLMLALLMIGSAVGLVCAQNQEAEKNAKQIEARFRLLAKLDRMFGQIVVFSQTR